MIVYYLDASVWVKRYYQEDGTSWVQGLFIPRQVLACSSLGMIEVMATLSRKRKALEINLSQFKLKTQELEDDWKHFIQIQMTDEIVHVAKELTKKLALRGSDSVHLSSVLLLQRHFSKKIEQLVMVTSDYELKSAAKTLRLDVIDPTEQIDMNKS
ncbi:MAG: type II toxin-antitoxin system VapC family toxin [Candidatus Brocadia sp.]|nr:type II toxin-antitoxin system VapC family toxin [Candidatus Brocadia sp.]